MIALGRTRAGMLAEIGATAALLASASHDDRGEDVLDSPEAHIVLQKHEPQELLPGHSLFLEHRFADLTPRRLERDLLWPLKKAVGNAHKRGNLLDPEKWITVELVATPAGLYLAVSDQGAGFDVEATLARFRAGETYFAHHGSGFRRFTKARSVVTFDDGGRTLRLRFLRERDRVDAAPSGDDQAAAE